MRELILDLQDVPKEGEDQWSDSPARAEIENAILDYAGKIIRVKITVTRIRGRD